ncbi:putative isoflavone reductase like protein P3 [Bisporella sp. PMI_857]|nr:putative isoflavone reductase like protein P3 [Bisporella sp. PMI_857]
MSTIKNVAVLGATGTLGKPVFDALVNSNKFNLTVVTRSSSKSTFPDSVTVKTADYSSVDSVATAFQGQDAVVSLVGNQGFEGQTVLIDAAIKAGVKRFLPSEFGSNIANPNTAQLPIFGHKVAIRKYIEEKAAANKDFTYSYVINGPFLDWGIEVGFTLAYQEGKPRIFNGGDQLVSSTSLATVGNAVVGVLTHPAETVNRDVYVEDIRISQNKLLALAKKANPSKSWSPVPADVVEVRKAADERLAKGDHGALFDYLFVGIFGEGYGALFDKTDNELLGIKGWSEDDVEAVWKKVLA